MMKYHILGYEIEVSPEELNRLKREVSNWMGLAKRIYKVTDKTELLKYMLAEKDYKNRYYIIMRIYGHFNSLRRDAERKMLNEIKELAQIEQNIGKNS
jgi:hypothetical protein